MPIPQVVEANNRFAADLHGRLKAGTPGNLFLSPYSISAALAMTYAGSAGETEREIAQVLHVATPESELHPAMAQLRRSLVAEAGEGNDLRVANRLWGQEGYGFLPQFLETTRKDYGAELGVVNFAQAAEEARQTINQWVEEQTEKKIKDLLPTGLLDPLTRLVLTNAVYFKGVWQEKFDAEATQEAPFHLASGQDVTAPMMHRAGEFGYRATDDLQILELAYAGNALSMVILLPRRPDGLAQLESQLTFESLGQWTKGLRRQKVIAYVPKFQFACQFSLKDVLQALGMASAFAPGKADFSRMSRAKGTTEGDLYITAVVHKAFVDVNEEGTEAVAATGVAMGLRSIRPDLEQPPVFRADHPFVFLIRDNRTGTLLFLGRVANPKP